MTSVSDRLTGQLAAIDYDDLSEQTAHAARRVLLDATGVMLGASGLASETKPFVDLARQWGAGPCRILGTDLSVPVQAAAMANGALAHALDFEDAFDLAPGHPNASLMPVLLALSQSHGPVDGRRFIAALVAGCELSCRLGLSLKRPLEKGGWYPPPILAGFGATIGAAHLLGLSPKQMRDALSLSLCQVTMPGEIKHSRTSVIRAVREAFPAQAAVISALLAQGGVAGFEEPLEGKAGFFALYAGGEFDADVLLAQPNRGFWIERLTFKPWPSCRGTHAFIDMALELRSELGGAANHISGIEIRHDDVQEMLVEPRPRKQAPDVPIDAKFSIPYCVAAALLDGELGLDSFAAERLKDPAILALAAKVVPEHCVAPNWRRGLGGELTIHLADGTSCSARRTDAPGGPDNALDDAALIDKFVACAIRAARPTPERQARELAEAILSIEQRDDVGALFA